MSRHYRIINKHTIVNILFPLTLATTGAIGTIGCSNHYTLPSESRVVVASKDLPSYNPKNFSKNSTNLGRKNKLRNEDQLIIKAIFLENGGAYKESNKFYALLYRETQKEEYLLKEINTAYLAGITSPNIDKLKHYTQKHPDNFQAQRLLLSFYLKEKQLEKAKEVGASLVEKSNKAIDFELAANPYIFAQEYEKSVEYLTQAYNKTFNEDILLKIVTIKINYLKNVNAAIADLERHRREHECSEKICIQLAAIYAQQHNPQKLISIYKTLYEKTHKEIYFEKTIESYLFNKELDNAISYLETKTLHQDLLYSLYMEQKSYGKAHNLAVQLSQKTNQSKWYAESAISEYESLTDKKDKEGLHEVMQNFEKAFELGEKNPVYFNYYGYTLIDNNIDIQKGIKNIQKALKEEPANSYFLDSLAWGYYKINNCQSSYETMKKVVEVEGLKDPEIVEHWNAINTKCKQ